jgi:hypothetical protein
MGQGDDSFRERRLRDRNRAPPAGPARPGQLSSARHCPQMEWREQPRRRPYVRSRGRERGHARRCQSEDVVSDCADWQDMG